MRYNDGGGAMMMAFICGALVGATLGILYAPKPGAQTREDLAQLGRKAREKADEIRDAVRQKVGV